MQNDTVVSFTGGGGASVNYNEPIPAAFRPADRAELHLPIWIQVSAGTTSNGFVQISTTGGLTVQSSISGPVFNGACKIMPFVVAWPR
jgi:hypothetical protein